MNTTWVFWLNGVPWAGNTAIVQFVAELYVAADYKYKLANCVALKLERHHCSLLSAYGKNRHNLRNTVQHITKSCNG
ncbi:hypothetical protein HYPSUDRAFT_659564 [Hypholoma sublateritium FD-334 SS-4]|uniref:Uncharacterized protein n=1 Tax=Hypholoma sublateritium (strain FD-334 SS-4) TaxID=945553 RepID=A0A0D2MFR7_HYPSF|nr:hypothetical protein HYPSUDRAFT_659564 [Hypholoma sublateritium FD-334 SS-4]